MRIIHAFVIIALALFLLLTACPTTLPQPVRIATSADELRTAIGRHCSSDTDCRASTREGYCDLFGGSWTEFSNECRGLCKPRRDKKEGKAVICRPGKSVMDCGCAPGQCWNGVLCEKL